MTDKPTLRRRVWTLLEEKDAARFPFPVRGRIPNFAGAEEAARRLFEVREWRSAKRVKCNPDSPQKPVRQAALEQGKEVLMAVPRLRDAKCFVRLDPGRVEGREKKAATIKGAFALGEQVGPDAVGPVDLVVAGSVAVDARGGRAGKGEGYSDLEYGLLRTLGLVDEETPVATTVHELQVVPEGEAVPVTGHDVPLDIIATPERVIRTNTAHPRPEGIDWGLLDEERIGEMPALQRLREEGDG